MTDISKALQLVVWDLNGGNNKINLKCFCCSAKLQLETSECAYVVPKKDGGTNIPTNLRPVCKKCKIATNEEGVYKHNVASPVQLTPVADFLAQRRGENSKFEDGTSAAMSHSKLAFLGITHLEWDTSKTFTTAELVADYKKLGDILHKYRICHRDDLGTLSNPQVQQALGGKKEEPKKEAAKPPVAEPQAQKTEAICVATTASGQQCTKKAKNGIYCGIHDKSK